METRKNRKLEAVEYNQSDFGVDHLVMTNLHKKIYNLKQVKKSVKIGKNRENIPPTV